MKKEILILTTTALLCLPLALPAAEKTTKKDPFLAADVDHDGKVSSAEFVVAMKGKLDQTAAQAKFAELDMNQDGALSREEFKPSGGRKTGGKKKKDGS